MIWILYSPPDFIIMIVQFSSVQDGIYAFRKAHKYELHPVYQKFPQRCLWNSSHAQRRRGSRFINISLLLVVVEKWICYTTVKSIKWWDPMVPPNPWTLFGASSIGCEDEEYVISWHNYKLDNCTGTLINIAPGKATGRLAVTSTSELAACCWCRCWRLQLGPRQTCRLQGALC